MNIYYKREILEIIKKVHPITMDELSPAFDYMYLKTEKKGKILKHSGSVELSSRLILKGYIGLFFRDKKTSICKEVFIPGTIGWDFHSYVTDEPSKLSLVCLTDVVFSEIKKSQEIEILSKLPNLSYVAVKFNQISSSYNFLWNQLLSLPNEEKLVQFFLKFPELFENLPDRLIWEILGLSKRTYYRLKKEFPNKLKGGITSN